MNSTVLSDVASNLLAFDLPIPDIILVLLAIALLALVNLAATRRQRRAVADVESAYLSEMARVTRQSHALESKLSTTKSELERERRRNRKSRQRDAE